MTELKYDQSKEFLITYSLLINAAQHRGFATYQEIAQAVGLPTSGSYMGSVLGEILGAVSANEKKQGRPMLSAIAVGSNGKISDGFFAFAKELGCLQAGEDQTEFWQRECSQVYETWKPTYRISRTKDV